MNSFSRPKKNRILKHLIQNGFSVGLLIILAACAAKPIAVMTTPPAEAIASDIQILILPPLIRFERTENESVLMNRSDEGDAFGAELLKAAKIISETRNFKIVASESLAGTAAVESCTQLHSLSYRLARGLINEDILSLLNNLASIDDRIVVLAQYMKIKVGPRGYWIQTTGSIGSPGSSSIIQAALISSKTGDVIWKNEVLLRALSKSGSPQFDESLRLLFKSFVKRKEG